MRYQLYDGFETPLDIYIDVSQKEISIHPKIKDGCHEVIFKEKEQNIYYNYIQYFLELRTNDTSNEGVRLVEVEHDEMIKYLKNKGSESAIDEQRRKDINQYIRNRIKNTFSGCTCKSLLSSRSRYTKFYYTRVDEPDLSASSTSRHKPDEQPATPEKTIPGYLSLTMQLINGVKAVEWPVEEADCDLYASISCDDLFSRNFLHFVTSRFEKGNDRSLILQGDGGRGIPPHGPFPSGPAPGPAGPLPARKRPAGGPETPLRAGNPAGTPGPCGHRSPPGPASAPPQRN